MIVFSVLNRSLQHLRVCVRFQPHEQYNRTDANISLKYVDDETISIRAWDRESLIQLPVGVSVRPFSSPVSLSLESDVVSFSIPVAGRLLLHPEFKPSQMPPNPELVNDWLFCHNHKHDDEDEEHQLRVSDSQSYMIRTSDQMQSFLQEKAIGSKVLIESHAGHESLLLKTLNANALILVNDDSSSDSSVVRLKSLSVILLQFQRLSHEEVQRNRLSFDVDWISVWDPLFHRMVRRLASNSDSTLIPVTCPDDENMTGTFVSLKELTHDDEEHVK